MATAVVTTEYFNDLKNVKIAVLSTKQIQNAKLYGCVNQGVVNVTKELKSKQKSSSPNTSVMEALQATVTKTCEDDKALILEVQVLDVTNDAEEEEKQEQEQDESRVIENVVTVADGKTFTNTETSAGDLELEFHDPKFGIKSTITIQKPVVAAPPPAKEKVATVAVVSGGGEEKKKEKEDVSENEEEEEEEEEDAEEEEESPSSDSNSNTVPPFSQLLGKDGEEEEEMEDEEASKDRIHKRQVALIVFIITFFFACVFFIISASVKNFAAGITMAIFGFILLVVALVYFPQMLPPSTITVCHAAPPKQQQ